MSTTPLTTVTWEDGVTQIFNNIPADFPEDKAIAKLEAQYKKKVKSFKRGTPTATSGSQSDRAGSSAPAPATGSGNAPATGNLPLSRPQQDDENDYRDKFPHLHTPKHMRRNRFGHLIYE